MQSSPTLKDLTFQLFDAAMAGDTAFIDDIYSRQRGTLQIGTDPAEWWEGRETIIRVWREQVAAMGGSMPVVAEDIDAWQEGDVGWVAVQGAIRVPGQVDTPLRFTAVYHKDGGEWKVVQAHASIGVRNEDTTFGAVPT
jgi:hypothetical protein